MKLILRDTLSLFLCWVYERLDAGHGAQMVVNNEVLDEQDTQPGNGALSKTALALFKIGDSV